MNLFEPAFKSFFKSKKLILYVISISLTFGLIISVIYSMTLLNDVLEDKIKNNIINRVLFVSSESFSDNEIKKINGLDNIDTAYRDIVLGTAVNVEKKYNFSIKYCMPEEILNVVKGNVFNNEDSYQVIIPSLAYDRTGKSIDLSYYLGKEIGISLDNVEVSAKVVGIQDQNTGYLYINEELKNYLVSINKSLESQSYITVIVDNYKNVDSVIDELKNKFGYSANLSDSRGQSDIKLYNLACLLIVAILVLAVVFNYVSISIIISSIINDETMDIAILKAIGYKIKDIYLIMKYRIFAIIGISIIVSTIIAILINQVIKLIINYKLEIVLQSDYCLFFFILLLFIIFIYVLSIVFVKLNNKRIKKVNTIDLLKEN